MRFFALLATLALDAGCNPERPVVEQAANAQIATIGVCADGLNPSEKPLIKLCVFGDNRMNACSDPRLEHTGSTHCVLSEFEDAGMRRIMVQQGGAREKRANRFHVFYLSENAEGAATQKLEVMTDKNGTAEFFVILADPKIPSIRIGQPSDDRRLHLPTTLTAADDGS